VEPRRKRIFRIVFGTHIGIIFLLVVIPFLRGCFHRKPKETILFIDLAAPTPSTVAEPILPSIKPEPAPEPEPSPIPKPEPKPTPKPKPKEPEPEKPKWEPAKVERQNRRVIKNPQTPAPVTPQPKRMTASDIQKALGTTRTTSANQHLVYCNSLQPRFYAVWQQPSSAPYGTKATATIRIGADGSILFRSLTSPSGNRVFDQSVQNALNAAQRLPAPPKVSVNRSITIDFVLD
jgi:TonB family protein